MTVRATAMRGALGAAAVVTLGVASGAPPASAAVELRSLGVTTITGASRGDRMGTSVAVVAGREPLVLAGAPGADGPGRANAGAAYLVKIAAPGRLRLADVTVLRLRGAAAGDRLGAAVASAGDVDGDGTADLLVGAPGADVRGRPGAGRAYVLFGGRGGSLDVGRLGGRGFEIDGPTGWDANGPNAPGRRGAAAGTAVAPAGDVDGDGLADLLVLAPQADNPGSVDVVGRAFVVFGKADGAPVDLEALGSRGVAIAPDDSGLSLPGGLAGGVDVNGDGIPDQAVGLDVTGDEGAGRAVVALGARPPADIGFHTSTFGGRGDAGARGTLALARDMGGDRRGELIVGSPSAGCGRPSCISDLPDANHRSLSGSVNVVRGDAGAPGTILTPGPSGGFRVDGPRKGAGAGAATAAPGDVDGDGRPDVSLGAPGTPRGFRPISGPTPGSAFVVFGSRSRRTVDLARLGARGFSYRGAHTGDRAGEAIAGGADLDRDGRPDVVVGAPRARDGRGTVTVVLSPATALSDRTARLVRGRIPVEVRCLAPRGHRCRGSLVLRTARRSVLVARKRIDLRAAHTTRLLFRGSRAARRRLASTSAIRLVAHASVYVSSSVADGAQDPDAPPPRPTTTTTARFEVRTGR